MKKLVMAAIAVFVFSNVNAQLREKGAIEIVPQIGFSSANYYGESGLNSDPITAVAFGVGGEYFFNNRWSLHTGLLFQTMGATGSGGYEEKLNYITLPVNANWHFGSTRKWNLNFGPSIGFLTLAEINGVDAKDSANTTQIGLNVGIGYKIEVSPKFSILIDYQSITGFSKVAKEGSSVKNSFGAFNIGAVIAL